MTSVEPLEGCSLKRPPGQGVGAPHGSTAVLLRPPQIGSLAPHFAPTDPPRGWDVARYPRVARVLRSRRFQFLLILPNQIIFWLVIMLGLTGTVVPGLNFGTAITWYVWFCLVFVMMVVVGRAWCAMCPFGGFAEWIQRRALWQRAQKTLGLGWKMPAQVAQYGFLLSVGTFVLLTYIEEFFNIAGPGAPRDTSWMVVGIVASALLVFLLFERRTFCRYLCPLTALIGSVGAMGSVAGFRTRDRDVCVTCATKDCMRGGESGYGCPWYTWPGSADSNLACGLCSECFKACGSDNIGLYLQPPLTSVIAPVRRRADVAWGVAGLWGLVLYQQLNATNGYASADSWLNRNLGFPHYPDPVAFVGTILLVAFATAGIARLFARLFAVRDQAVATAGAASSAARLRTRSFLDRPSRFRSFFLPMSYGLIPLVGADYFARQLPKFFKHATRVIPSVGEPFGAGSTHSTLYSTHILAGSGIVAVQLLVIALGTLAAAWSSWRIASRDLAPVSRRPRAVRWASCAVPVVLGAGVAVLYSIMHAAS
ncbi:MAG: 4Fe-4S binding protein [Mycobacteriales bacterium]